MAQLKRNAAAGASTVKLRESALDGVGSFLAKFGTELVTVSGQAGDTWNVSPSFAEPHHARSFAVEATIRIVVNGVDHTAVAQHLRHSEAWPEGEIEATWEIDTRDVATYSPNMDGNPVPFLLYSNETGAYLPFFGGYLGRIDDKQDPSGIHHLKITGRGGYITLNWEGYETSHVWTADTSGHQILEDAIGVYGRWISPTRQYMLDGGLQIGQELDGIGRTPRALIDLVAARGDLLGPLDWGVRTDLDGVQKFHLAVHGRQPTIDIPISSLRPPTMSKDYELVRNKVVIKWQGGFVSQTAPGATGATRWRYFDFSSRIDNEDLALQVAKAYLRHWATITAISNGQVELLFPNPIGGGVAHHRIRAGWNVNITGWTGGFSIAGAQIKALEADHEAHKVGLNLGAIEDDMNYSELYVAKQAGRVGNAVSGLLPLNIAPPEGMPYQVRSTAIAPGSTGLWGWSKIAAEADIIAPVHYINAGKDALGNPVPISAGRKYPDFQIGVGGRIMGFKLVGNDGADPPGDCTISLKVGKGAFGEAPLFGTEITTIGITASTTGEKNLKEAPAVIPDLIQNVTPGDYLAFDVQADPAPTANNIGIMVLIQRTEGSFRTPDSGAPLITSQSYSRDPLTGESLFQVTTNRPCVIQIEYGTTTSYGNWTLVSPVIAGSLQLRDRQIATPFHWRVHAKDADKHETIGADQTG